MWKDLGKELNRNAGSVWIGKLDVLFWFFYDFLTKLRCDIFVQRCAEAMDGVRECRDGTQCGLLLAHSQNSDGWHEQQADQVIWSQRYVLYLSRHIITCGFCLSQSKSLFFILLLLIIIIKHHIDLENKMCASTNTKAVYGICTDIHNQHRFASFFENQVSRYLTNAVKLDFIMVLLLPFFLLFFLILTQRNNYVSQSSLFLLSIQFFSVRPL